MVLGCEVTCEGRHEIIDPQLMPRGRVSQPGETGVEHLPARQRHDGTPHEPDPTTADGPCGRPSEPTRPGRRVEDVGYALWLRLYNKYELLGRPLSAG